MNFNTLKDFTNYYSMLCMLETITAMIPLCFLGQLPKHQSGYIHPSAIELLLLRLKVSQSSEVKLLKPHF